MWTISVDVETLPLTAMQEMRYLKNVPSFAQSFASATLGFSPSNCWIDKPHVFKSRTDFESWFVEQMRLYLFRVSPIHGLRWCFVWFGSCAFQGGLLLVAQAAKCSPPKFRSALLRPLLAKLMTQLVGASLSSTSCRECVSRRARCESVILSGVMEYISLVHLCLIQLCSSWAEL